MLPLTKALKSNLRAEADPVRAQGQQAYMKSSMPFHGVAAPDVARICRTLFREYPMASQKEWHANLLDIWRQANHREEWYAAQNLAAVRAYRKYQDMSTLPIYREMIVDGAWWDVVDGIVGRLGELLLDYPAPMKKKMMAWATVKNFWQRRAVIISQLKLKDKTDMELLVYAIKSNMHDNEFFVRKAIGWALRSHSITDPDWVRAFVREHEHELSPLSRKEALKRLERSK